MPLFNNKDPRRLINFGLLGVLGASLLINQAALSKNSRLAGVPQSGLLTKLTLKFSGGADLTGDLKKDALKLALAQGVPVVYGAELNVGFDRVEASMNIMKELDPTYGSKKIKLTGELLKRYIDVGKKISCEYCCGAGTLVKDNGEAACGCAHSQAMRGLAAYLLQNHAGEYSDDQILRELARWKGSYFPQAMVEKISAQLSGGEYTPDVAALLLGLKMPKYSGASQGAPAPSEIKNLPGQVGGC